MVQQSSDDSVSATTQNPTGALDFKEFVDNHVQATTRFKTAEDLLNKSKPLMFIWICFAAVALVVLLLPGFQLNALSDIRGIAGFLLVVVIFGYVVSYLAGRIIYFRFWKNHGQGKYSTVIDPDDLVAFLNTRLQYLSPYFKEWGRCDQKDNIQIGFKFSKSTDAVINLFKNSTPGAYWITARKGSVINYVILSPNGLSGGKTDAGFGRYVCLYKTAPIISAVLEYYLKSTGSYESTTLS